MVQSVYSRRIFGAYSLPFQNPLASKKIYYRALTRVLS